MEAIDVVLIMVGLLLILVMAGVRVAFAAAFVGLLGLTIHFAIVKDKGLADGFIRAVKIAGLTPHSKLSSQTLGLIPTFIIIGFLAYYVTVIRPLL